MSVDHIIPYAVCPALDNVIANLQLMPLRENESKSDSVTSKGQCELAYRLWEAGLLSKNGPDAVIREWKKSQKKKQGGDPKALKLRALADPDLEPLWKAIGSI